MSIPNTDRSRKYGVTVSYGDIAGARVTSLPQKIALISQGATASTFTEGKRGITSAAQVADIAGYGSPAHLQSLELFPTDGRAGVGAIPVDLFLMDDASTGVAAVYTISATDTISEDTVFTVRVGGVQAKQFVASEDDDADTVLGYIKDAITAELKMPVTAGTVTTGALPLTFKAAGEIGNNLEIEINSEPLVASPGEVFSGMTFSIAATTAGAVNPDITDMLDLIDNEWYTVLIMGTAQYTDTTTLDAVETFVKGRWSPLVKKPCVAIWATSDDYATRAAVTSIRPLDYANSVTAFKDAPNMWHVLGARHGALIAVTANAEPARNYASLVDGAIVSDTSSETDAIRELSLQGGCGTASLFNGRWIQHDTITMYAPEGNDNPEYRYVVDIMKLANLIYTLDQVVGAQRLKGLPLLADTAEVTSSQEFIRPRDMAGLLKNLADQQLNQLLLAESDYTKDNLTVQINSTNPKRLDIFYPARMSGNAEIFDVSLRFAFYFGQ